MSMIVWALLGLSLAVITSRIVKTSGEGRVIDLLIGVAGAIGAGALFSRIGGRDANGLNVASGYAAVAAVIGAILLLAVYRAFFWRQMR